MKIRKLIVTCIESCFVRIVGKIGQKLNKPLFICIIPLRLHGCFWQVWLDEESPGNDWLLPCFRCNVLPNHRHALYFRRNIFSPLLMVYAFFQFVIELPYWRYSGHSKCHSLFVLMDTFVWAFVFFEKRALSRIFIRLLLLSRKQICQSVYLSSIMQHTNNTEHGTN